jgi:hypothetical protein
MMTLENEGHPTGHGQEKIASSLPLRSLAAFFPMNISAKKKVSKQLCYRSSSIRLRPCRCECDGVPSMIPPQFVHEAS